MGISTGTKSSWKGTRARNIGGVPTRGAGQRELEQGQRWPPLPFELAAVIRRISDEMEKGDEVANTFPDDTKLQSGGHSVTPPILCFLARFAYLWSLVNRQVCPMWIIAVLHVNLILALGGHDTTCTTGRHGDHIASLPDGKKAAYQSRPVGKPLQPPIHRCCCCCCCYHQSRHLKLRRLQS